MAQLNSGIAQIAALRSSVQTIDRSITFSQAAGAPAITGGSPKFRVGAAGSIAQVALLVTSAPVGGPLTVQYLRNGVVFATLQVPDGSTTTVTSSDGLPTLTAGDELSVSATEVGTGTPAQGVTAQMVRG